MRIKSIKIILLLLFLFFCNYISAGTPAIISMNMNPTNPGWGQQFVVNMQICHDAYNSENDLDIAVSTSNTFWPANTGGQIFLVSSSGVDVHSTNPLCLSGQLANNGCDMGYEIPNPAPTPVLNCDTCANSGSFDGYTQNLQFNLTMPQASDMGMACGVTTLYLLAATKSSGLMSPDWAGFSANACANNGDTKVFSWPLPVPPADSVTIDKRVEGVLQNVGDMVLFSIDYTFGNGPLTITDTLPGEGSLALVSVGPSQISGGSVTAPTAGSTSGTVTWTFPTSTYMKSGTVWMLLQMTTAMASGTNITNNATATSGSNNATASATIIVGDAAISVQKMQSVNSFMKLPGGTATVTYYLNYQVNGDQLQALRLFDDTATGTYGVTNSPPAGWKMLPYNSDYGTWTISDPCNTGDRILTGAGQSSSYPAMLLDDPTPSNVQICTGIVEADVFINPGTYPGADGLIILRNNGLAGTNNYGYSLYLSMDTAPLNGYVGYQKCGGVTCGFYGAETFYPITGNTWYRTKTWMTTNGTDYIFNSKVWQVGQPEPSGYTVSWTDAGAANNASWNCSGTGTYTDWRPGVGNQSGDGNGTVQDSYNNFMILVPKVAANATLYDTIPTGLTYSGSNPTIGGTDGSMITWNLGTISDQNGSYTWWATTSACNESFTNVGGIGATGMVSEFSNPVAFNIICTSPTPTITPTLTPAFTMVKTASKTLITTTNDMVTFNVVFCNTSGGATQSFTIIDDWSSAYTDGWQFNWSNNTNVNAGGIATIQVNSNNGVETISVVPTPGGFTGCYTWQMWLVNNSNLQTCNWSNNASLVYPGIAASPVSTVIMHDQCGTPTLTITPTVNIGLLTTSPTVTPSFTVTPTLSYTQTPSATCPCDTLTVTPTNTITTTYTCGPCVWTYTVTVTFTTTTTQMPSITPSVILTNSDSSTFTVTPTYTTAFGTLTNTPISTPTSTQTQQVVPPANSLTLAKRAEGVLQSVGDLVLFSVDYSYGNGPLTITDAIPGGGDLSLVSIGPVSITGGTVNSPAIGATSGTVTWTFPTSTYTKTGTVWMLLQMTTSMASGTVITNTANGTSGSNDQASSASVTVGGASISVQKMESISSLSKQPGDTGTITYYLNYQVNGDQLKAYRPFDDTATGTYGNSGPPAGWKLLPYTNGDNGTWTITDPYGTGDRILTGAAQTASYPALLLDDPNPSNVQICTGIVEADVFINPGTYPGSDGLVILRDNGQADGNHEFYSLILSIDTAPADGYIAIQKCAGSSCSWNGASSAIIINGNTWYRTKTYMTTNGTDYTFQSKVWQVGQPEPTGYQVVWTDTGAASNAAWNCSGTGTYTDWRPGVGEQAGDYGTTQDSYNNFILYTPRVAANATLYDTVPTGLTYSGSNPGAGTTSPMVSWNLGNISNQSGSYTWWATTNACNQSFTNVAGIGAAGLVSEFSNQVFLNVTCASPTSTPTPTPAFTIQKTSSKTVNITKADQLTFNIVVCNSSGAITQNFTVYDDWSSGSNDQWQYQNPYYTSSPAPGIYSLTANVDNPSTGWTQFIFVPTPTGFTGCFTFQMFLGGAQSNNTCLWHNNASLAYNGIPSPVSTVILQDQCIVPTLTTTPTVNTDFLTISPTASLAITSTPTFTITTTQYVSTLTNTPTLTFTPTLSFTPTLTFTPTPSFTVTASLTYTATLTNTVNVNPTLTYFVNATLTATYAAGMSTPTFTPTYSQTPQASGVTPTLTVTATPQSKKPLPYPNPWHRGWGHGLTIRYNFIQGIDKITIKVYSSSFRLVEQDVFTEAQMQQIIAQGYVSLDTTALDGLAAGTYYYVIIIDNNGKTERSEVDKLIILK